MLSPDVLAAYAVAIATAVSSLISTIIKPLIETIPAFSPSAPDPRGHDALLRGINLLLNVVGVLLLAAAYGQLTLANWEPLTLQVVIQTLGSHVIYQTVKPSAPAGPLHQQSAEEALPSAPAAVDGSAI